MTPSSSATVSVSARNDAKCTAPGGFNSPASFDLRKVRFAPVPAENADVRTRLADALGQANALSMS